MAKKAKESFIIHYSKAKQLITTFSEEDIGKAFKAFSMYEMYGELPEIDDPTLRLMVDMICSDLDDNRKKYNDTCEKNRLNRQKAWDKKLKEKEADNSPPVEMPEEVRTKMMKMFG